MSDPSALHVTVINQRREIARLAELFDERAKAWGLSEDDTCNVQLMLDEFVSNVIKYGYADRREHQIDVDVALAGGLLTIRIEDDGKAFNPLDAPPPKFDLPIEERPIGGLGVYIVKTLADSIDYRRDAGRNVLTMTRRVERSS